MPRSRAQASSGASCASGSAATISRTASAPIERASATWYSSTMKSLRNTGSAHAARAAILSEGLLIYLMPQAVGELAVDLARPASFRHWVVDVANPTLIEMMKQQRLREDRYLRRAEFQFSVVTDEDVFQQSPQFGREMRKLIQFGTNDAQADDDVSQ